MSYTRIAPSSNFTASANPAITDDNSRGYSVGSFWFRSDTGQMWRCRDATASAARWDIIGSADHPGYVANNYYFPIGTSLGTTGVTKSAATMSLIPGIVKSRITISNLLARIGTTSAGGKVQCAIYAADPTTKKPTGSQLVASADISTTSAGWVAGAASLQLEPGLYWWAANMDNATATLLAAQLGMMESTQLVGTATANNLGSGSGGATFQGLTTAVAAYNTWGDLTSATFADITTAISSLIAFQVASAP